MRPKFVTAYNHILTVSKGAFINYLRFVPQRPFIRTIHIIFLYIQQKSLPVEAGTCGFGSLV